LGAPAHCSSSHEKGQPCTLKQKINLFAGTLVPVFLCLFETFLFIFENIF
jgi:hypothetical protein